MDIFSGLANKSNNPLSETEDDMADLSASIDVLNVMADASLNVVLEEEVLPVRNMDCFYLSVITTPTTHAAQYDIYNTFEGNIIH